MVAVVIGSVDANNGDDSKMKRLLRSCGDEDKDSCRSLWDATAVVVGVGMTWDKAGVCATGGSVEGSVLLGIWELVLRRSLLLVGIGRRMTVVSGWKMVEDSSNSMDSASTPKGRRQTCYCVCIKVVVYKHSLQWIPKYSYVVASFPGHIE